MVVRYEPVASGDRSPRTRSTDDATLLFPEHGSNVALHWSQDAEADAWDSAELTVSGEVVMPRLATAPMEGLSVLAVPVDDDGQLTIWASTQSPHAVLVQVARALDLDWNRLRVRTPQVGGAFGGKSLGGLADYVVAAAVALRLGRPVRCVEDRAANLTTMQGRGMRLRFELHARRDGSLVGLDVDELCDSGAYPSTNSVEPGKTMMMASGPYRLASVRFRGRSVVTNLCSDGGLPGTWTLGGRRRPRAGHGPAGPGARHRPRRAAPAQPPPRRRAALPQSRRGPLRRVGLPGQRRRSWSSGPATTSLRAEQRRRRSAGDHLPARHRRLHRARQHRLVRAHRAGRRPRRRPGRRAGPGRHPLGRPAPCRGPGRAGRRRPAGAGRSDVEVIEGDTADIAGSAGTSGSRSMQLAGSAVLQASEIVLAKARSLTARLLEASEDDIVVIDGRLGVRGVPTSSLAWAEVAAQARRPSTPTACSNRPTRPTRRRPTCRSSRSISRPARSDPSATSR